MKKLSLLFVLIASSVSAQDYSPHVYIGSWYEMGGGRFEYPQVTPEVISAEKESAGAQNPGRLQADSASTAVNSEQLRFTPSMQRRRANYAGFVERSRRVDPAGADGLAANFKLDPIALMQPQLAQVGLRTDNVADAYAAYWIEAWEAVHGVTGQTSREKAGAVKRQSAAAILATPAFATATSAQKQELAEAMLVQAMLVATAREQANGDEAKLVEIGRAAEKGACASGFDLRSVTLTEEGFRPAN